MSKVWAMREDYDLHFSGRYLLYKVANSVKIPICFGMLGRFRLVCVETMGTYVCSFQTQTSLKESKNLIEVATALVSLYDGRELLSMYDDIETTDLRLYRSQRSSADQA